jgi:hypothetical protein
VSQDLCAFHECITHDDVAKEVCIHLMPRPWGHLFGRKTERMLLYYLSCHVFALLVFWDTSVRSNALGVADCPWQTFSAMGDTDCIRWPFVLYGDFFIGYVSPDLWFKFELNMLTPVFSLFVLLYTGINEAGFQPNWHDGNYTSRTWYQTSTKSRNPYYLLPQLHPRQPIERILA